MQVAPGAGAVVLHEDKRYYADAEEVYGEHVETLVEDEDAQALEDALVTRLRTRPCGVWDVAFRIVRDDGVFTDLYYAMDPLEDDAALRTRLRSNLCRCEDAARYVRVAAHRSVTYVRARRSPFAHTQAQGVVLRDGVPRVMRYINSEAHEEASVG